ncbi:CPBP family glutamic-type intramembrane protease [Verrucomicrobiales bacterium BCK34]|nr:CPBP family glutamic-type intramembrane protease [Verrucomicrobiales bacterium BCK34]
MIDTTATPDRNAKRWFLVVPAMCLPLAASFFYFVLFPGTILGNSFYSGIKVFLLIWPFLAVCLWLKEPLIERVREKRHLPSSVAGFAFGAVVFSLLVWLVKESPFSYLVTENSARISERIRGLGVAEHYLWFALFISFAHAALEEFFWRWFVFGQLRRLISVPWACFWAAVGFAAHHVVILTQFFPVGWALVLGACVGIGGAVWSLIYHRYGSLLGAWISHMIIDLGLMWVGWIALNG